MEGLPAYGRFTRLRRADKSADNLSALFACPVEWNCLSYSTGAISAVNMAQKCFRGALPMENTLNPIS